jgi:hypothetical protein
MRAAVRNTEISKTFAARYAGAENGSRAWPTHSPGLSPTRSPVRHRNCDCDHLLNLCPFVSMFAKASGAGRNGRSDKQLRRQGLCLSLSPGHKKSQFLAAALVPGPILRAGDLTPAKSDLTYSSRNPFRPVPSPLRFGPLQEGNPCRRDNSLVVPHYGVGRPFQADRFGWERQAGKPDLLRRCGERMPESHSFCKGCPS